MGYLLCYVSRFIEKEILFAFETGHVLPILVSYRDFLNSGRWWKNCGETKNVVYEVALQLPSFFHFSSSFSSVFQKWTDKSLGQRSFSLPEKLVTRIRLLDISCYLPSCHLLYKQIGMVNLGKHMRSEASWLTLDHFVGDNLTYPMFITAFSFKFSGL